MLIWKRLQCLNQTQFQSVAAEVRQLSIAMSVKWSVRETKKREQQKWMLLKCLFVCIEEKKKKSRTSTEPIEGISRVMHTLNLVKTSSSNIRMQISFVRWFFIFSNTMCLVVCVLVFLFDFFLSLFPSFSIHLACSLCCYPLFCGNLCQCCVWANVCALERERECEIISLLFFSSKIRINQIKAIYKVNISINVLECVGLEQNSDDDTPTRLMKF